MELREIPTIEVANPTDDDTTALRNLANSIVAKLKQYPHFAVVRGYPVIGDRSNLVGLAQAVQAIGKSDLGELPRDDDRVSFTKVRVDRPQDYDRDLKLGITHYSRTELALPPHTDSSYLLKPHELVAFQCLVADAQGGQSIIVPLTDVLERIDDGVKNLLRESVYPLGKELSPIIYGEDDDLQIKYYQAQLQRLLKNREHTLSEAHWAAVQTLDRILESEQLGFRFNLMPGSIVMIHNTKTLHGRTELSAHSDRLLYRVRLHVPSLACPPEYYSKSQPIATAQVSNHQPATESKLDLAPVDAVNTSQLPPQARQELKAAIKAKDDYNFQAALQHFQTALKLAPQELKVLREFGIFLVNIGKFAIARKILQRCLEIAPDDFETNLEMAGLADEDGEFELSQAILKRVAQQHPYSYEGKTQADKPTILRIRSFHNSKYCIVRDPDGLFHSVLQRGHFSLKDLLEHEDYNAMVLNPDAEIEESVAMPPFALAINTIACPDLKRSSLLAAARFCDRYPHLPIINSPRRVLETTRERNAMRLNTISGVIFPQTESITWDGTSITTFISEIAGLGFELPFIIRQVGTQTGKSMSLIKDFEELEKYLPHCPEGQNFQYYLIQYHDCRYNEQIYSKTRVFFIDGKLYPVANLYNDTWNIHSGDRYRVMYHTQWLQDAEKSFLNDPESYLGQDNIQRLNQIYDLIQLDFMGIDFTVTQDGKLFVFETNAAMRHNFDHAVNFPYTEPFLNRVSLAFNDMVQMRLGAE